jgi:hypothetical protein
MVAPSLAAVSIERRIVVLANVVVLEDLVVAQHPGLTRLDVRPQQRGGKLAVRSRA